MAQPGRSSPVEPQFHDSPRDTPGPSRSGIGDLGDHARVRRNTACVRCRDAKVRCNASSSSGQPCLRCSKLELHCVVDKSHKRTSRRSKLEELAAEVQNIKDAVTVAPRTLLDLSSEVNPSSSARPSISVQIPNLLHHPHPGHLQSAQPLPEPNGFIPAPPPPPAPPSLFGRQRLYSISTELPIQPLTPARSSDVPSTSTAHFINPAEPRALGSRVFSGEDIDYYFEKCIPQTSRTSA